MILIEQLKAYKFRIYPTKEQETFFIKSFGCVRKVYNLMLNDRIKAYEEVKKYSSKKMSFPTPAKYKKEFPFLKEVDSLALANAQLNLDKAYKNFLKINLMDSLVLKARKILFKVTQQIIKMEQYHYLIINLSNYLN